MWFSGVYKLFKSFLKIIAGRPSGPPAEWALSLFIAFLTKLGWNSMLWDIFESVRGGKCGNIPSFLAILLAYSAT